MFDMLEFNGVKLNPFPENWVKEDFPYALITIEKNGYIFFVFDSKPLVRVEDGLLIASRNGNYKMFSYNSDGTISESLELGMEAYTQILSGKVNILWTNWNLQWENAFVYLYASTPLPVTKWSTQKINIDIAMKKNREKIDAVQNDQNSRNFVIYLHENGSKWNIPENSEISLSYVRPDGKGAIYSKNENEENAWAIADNAISFIPPKEMFEKYGIVKSNIKIVNNDFVLKTFNFEVEVEADPFDNLLAEDIILPEEKLYLYGTQSESGNIGLRSGDSVTYYRGVVAPHIDTVYTDELKVTNPYAYVAKSGVGYTAYHLCFTEKPQTTLNGIIGVTGETYKLVDGEWVAATGNAGSDPLWSNTDIYYSGNSTIPDGTLYMAASDPIPVSEIVDYDGDIPIYEVIT